MYGDVAMISQCNTKSSGDIGFDCPNCKNIQFTRLGQRQEPNHRGLMDLAPDDRLADDGSTAIDPPREYVITEKVDRCG